MKKYWQRWKNLMIKVGDFQASVLFSILYFTLVTPTGIVASALKDFLLIKKAPEWLDFEDTYSNLSKLKKQ